MTDSPFGGCLYEQTAPAPPPTGSLAGDMLADLLVIGAGFTGLSTALHAAERGLDAVVVCAGAIGAGASGRNHGHCVPVMRFDTPEGIRHRLGADRGERFVRLFADAGREVFDLVRRHGIDCEAAPVGTLEVAHAPEALKEVHAQCARYAALGKATVLLNAEQVAHITGCRRYYGGWVHPEGGHLNPLALCRGLAKAAIDAGARIYTESPVRRIAASGGHWLIQCPEGRIVADRIVIATNAHTGSLWPGLGDTYVTLRAYGLATDPLGEDLREQILPGNHNLGDSRPDVHFYRFDRENRLIVGGLVEHRRGRDAVETASLMGRRMAWLYPPLGGIRWRWFWQGTLAVNPDVRPHFYAPAPGIAAVLGYSGRGLSTATAMGRVLADWARGQVADDLPLPTAPIRPVRSRRLLSVLVPRLRGPFNRMRDRRRARRGGREPSPT